MSFHQDYGIAADHSAHASGTASPPLPPMGLDRHLRQQNRSPKWSPNLNHPIATSPGVWPASFDFKLADDVHQGMPIDRGAYYSESNDPFLREAKYSTFNAPSGVLSLNQTAPTQDVGSQAKRNAITAPRKNADGKFTCPHCNKTYLHEKDLKRHLFRHTGDRPYMCHLCRDTFSRSDTLKRHFQKCSLRRANLIKPTTVALQRCDTNDKDSEPDEFQLPRRGIPFLPTVLNRDFEQQAEGEHGFKGEHQCHVCAKAEKCECYLRDHMKRHTKPYGCTFGKCYRRFRSRNDWKRHEYSQHILGEMWRCVIKDETDKTACGYFAHDRETIVKHLVTVHNLAADAEETNSLCRDMYMGRDGQHHFWCGFCDQLIEQAQGVHPEAWGVRFKHIGDHFDKDNRNIDDWIDVEKNKMKKVLEDEEKMRSNDRALPKDEHSSPPIGPGPYSRQRADSRVKLGDDSKLIDDNSHLGEQTTTFGLGAETGRNSKSNLGHPKEQHLKNDSIPFVKTVSELNVNNRGYPREPISRLLVPDNPMLYEDGEIETGKDESLAVGGLAYDAIHTKAAEVQMNDPAIGQSGSWSTDGRIEIDAGIDKDLDGLKEHVEGTTVAPTMTDEGYCSMDKQQAEDLANEDARSDTDSVRTDNRESGLPREMKERLSESFADEILGDLRLQDGELANALEKISSVLPDLLRDFSTLAECRAQGSVEEKACIFVRHQRNKIAQELEVRALTRPDNSTAPSAEEKIALLWLETRNAGENAGENCMTQAMEITTDHLCDDSHETDGHSNGTVGVDGSIDSSFDRDSLEMDGSGESPRAMDISIDRALLETDDSDSYPDLPQLPAARTFLIEHPEYQSLLRRIESQARTTSVLSTDRSVRRDLTDVMKDGRNATIRLEWDISSFMNDQYGELGAVQLEQVLCYSGLAENAYLAPCVEYVQLIWPRLGSELVSSLSKALRNSVDFFSESLSDGTALNLVLDSRYITLRARGAPASLVELGEILAWIGAACRASPTERASYCLPHIVPHKEDNVCSIKFEFLDIISSAGVVQKQDSKCWLQMVRNPAIAYGYPIPVRHNEETGLEVSLPIMACLGAAPRVVDFYQMQFLKGFCSLFVPMMQIGQSIIWHFLLEADGKRISYNRDLDLQTECVSLSSPILEQSRHFVGWTSSAKILAGTREAKYDVALSSSKFNTSGFATLKNVNITAGYIVQVGANIAPGKKDTSVTIAEARDSRPYEQQMDAASEMFVNFYDTDAQKGWLLDGATALLHLTRAWLSSSYASFSSEQAVAKFTYPSAFDGRRSSLSTLNLEANRGIELYSKKQRTTETCAPESKWCWEQLVEQKWFALEKIHDYMDRLTRTSPQLPSALRSSALEGIEFLDILSNKATVKLKTISLDSDTATWLDVTRDNGTINIFGSGFGDLIIPSSIPGTNPSCSQQTFVPAGNDYLIAPLYVIRKMADSYDEREDGSVSLGESAYWTEPGKCITKCPCACKKTRKCRPSLVQLKAGKVSMDQLESLLDSIGKKRKLCPKTDIFKCHPHGAVIFGNEAKTPTRKPRKRKQNFDDEPSRNTRARMSDSGVDVGSSGTSQDASSPSQSQPSLEDSGISESHSVGSN